MTRQRKRGHFLLICFVCIMPVCGCSPQSTEVVSPAAIISQLSAPSEQPSSTVSSPSNLEFTLCLRSNDRPAHYSLFEFSASCFSSPSEPCKPLQEISPTPALEQPCTGDTPISWSPDGSQALIIDPNYARILRLDPQTWSVDVFISDLPITNPIITWSADGEKAYLVTEAASPYVYNLSEINLEDGNSRQILEDLEGQTSVLGWRNPGQLLLSKFTLEPANNDTKRNADGQTLLTLDVRNSLTEPVYQQFNWLEYEQLALSPDGKKLAFSNPEAISILDLDDLQVQSFGQLGGNINWSPKGDKIAAFLGDDLSVLDTETGEINQIFSYHSISAICWFPDGKQLLVTGFQNTEDNIGTYSQLFVVPLTDEAYEVRIDSMEYKSFTILTPVWRNTNLE